MVKLRTDSLVLASHICDYETWYHNQKCTNLTLYIVFIEQFYVSGGEALGMAFRDSPVGRHLWKVI